MTEAARRATSLSRPTWIMAAEQTAARGRQGKTWVQPAGNLAATLIYRPIASPSQAAQRSFIAALALLSALKMHSGNRDLALKWPNDVLLDGGKVAGILLEANGTSGQVNWLSIGFGVNLAQAPDDQGGAFAPVALGGDVSPGAFLGLLARSFAKLEAQFCADGFAPIREAWLRHAARLGQTIKARTGDNIVTGRFETIDKDGNLVLGCDDGPKTIAAADVFF